MTYIPKQTKITKERVEVKLDADLVRQLQRYCEYLDSDRDYVIAQALGIAFRKDKAFTDWLEKAGDAAPQVGAATGGKKS